jgi:GGDEF domain-containing protein
MSFLALVEAKRGGEIAERLHASIAPGFQVAGLTLDVEASIGIATMPSSTDIDPKVSERAVSL